MLCGFDPRIGHKQGRLELFVKGIVNLRSREDRRNAAASFAQASFEFAKPSLARRNRCLRLGSFWFGG